MALLYTIFIQNMWTEEYIIDLIEENKFGGWVILPKSETEKGRIDYIHMMKICQLMIGSDYFFVEQKDFFNICIYDNKKQSIHPHSFLFWWYIIMY